MNYILIDGSYFVYYRYYALCSWWKLSKQEGLPSVSNPIFKEKFDKMFPLKVKEIIKKLKLKTAKIFVAKDCSRIHIWRKKLYPWYKDTRKACDESEIEIFNYVQDNKLFETANCEVINHPGLEADDCLALLTKKIIELNENNMVYIIANDADYIQLVKPNVSLLNLKFKSLVNEKTVFDDPKKTLFCKIVSGDKSDNIPPIASGIGIKKAIYYYENLEEFQEFLNQNKDIYNQYKINLNIIDFNYIPNYLVEDFNSLCILCLSFE